MANRLLFLRGQHILSLLNNAIIRNIDGFRVFCSLVQLSLKFDIVLYLVASRNSVVNYCGYPKLLGTFHLECSRENIFPLFDREEIDKSL